MLFITSCSNPNNKDILSKKSDDEGKHWGLVNSSGEYIIPPKYTSIDKEYFNDEGLIKVELNQKYGYVDSNGDEIIPAEYDYVSPFIDGIAKLFKGKLNSNKKPLKGKYGVANNKGNITPLKYDYIGPVLIDGIVCTFIGETSLYGHNTKNGKYGLVNNTKEIVPCIYDNIITFDNELASVDSNGKYGFINKSGKVVIPLEYDFTYSYFSENLVIAFIGETNDNKRIGKYVYLDKKGNQILSLGIKYDNASNFSDGLALVLKNSKFGFINKSGKEVIAIKYEEAESFKNEISLVKLNSKYGFINKKGEVIIEIKYDNALSFYGEEALVELNGEQYYINKQGRQTRTYNK